MPEKVIRVAIAGQGRSGFDIHASWLRQAPQQYRIVAVADLIPERRAQAKKEFGCRAHKTWEDLIQDGDYDLFINALPSLLHPKVAIAALKAGHHTVCEKPLSVRVKDFDAMVAASLRSGRLLACFQNSRFVPFFGKIREVIASGVLGEILHVRINQSGFARRWDWQTRQDLWGGNINNTGPHPLDHAVMLFGERAAKVFSKLVSGPNTFGDADDFALVVLHGKGAPTVEVLVSSYQAWPQGEMYSVSGSRGGLTGGRAGLKWRYFDPKKAPRQRLHRDWSIKRGYCAEQLPWVEGSWTAPALELSEVDYVSKCFYDNVYDTLVNGAKLVVTPDQVRRQVAVLEACHRQNRLPKLGAKT
jgi:scyllo-inositol 2-dehydrogenase (NADP+)